MSPRFTRPITRRQARLYAGLALLGMVPALGACTVETSSPPPPQTQVVVTTPAIPPAPIVAPGPPPAPPAELVPPPPQGSGPVVWQPGHWNWNGQNWAWLRGQYTAPPAGMSQWVVGRWQQQTNGGWSWIEGHWA